MTAISATMSTLTKKRQKLANKNHAQAQLWVNRIHERTSEEDQYPQAHTNQTDQEFYDDNNPVPRCIEGAQDLYEKFCSEVYMAVQVEIANDNVDMQRIKDAMKYWWEEGDTLSKLHTAFDLNWDSLPYPDDEDEGDGGWEPFATQVHAARKELAASGIYRK